MAKVVVFRGRRKEATHQLKKREVTIGRGEGADIRVDNPLVSRQHGVVTFRDSEWRVADLDSPNGVYVNGERVKEVVLKPGDKIELGQHVLVFAGAGDNAWDVDTVPERGRIDGTFDEPTAILPPQDVQSINRKVQRRMKAHLIVKADGGRTEVPLVGAKLVLGYDDECDVRLPGKALFTKKVAELTRRGSGWAMVALTSLTPVRVGGERVSTQELRDGDVISIKDVEITVHLAVSWH